MRSLPILIIEDDVEQLSLLATMLGNEAYSIMTALTGQHALDILQTTPTVPALVITDMVMPDIPGGQIIQFIRSQERFKSTRIVIVTSYERYITPADRQLVDKILLKPVQKSQLIQTIQELFKGNTDSSTTQFSSSKSDTKRS